jgi:hypothetical protein
MNNSLIKKYIEGLKKKDIIAFVEKENVFISEKEVDLIYDLLKLDADTILSSDFYSYIEQYKSRFNEDLYNLIIEKYEKYKYFIN